MKSDELKEYIFSKGYKIFQIKARIYLKLKRKRWKSTGKDVSL